MVKSSQPVVWVYQLSAGDWDWDQNSYRLEVAEGERVAWPVGKKQTKREPQAGERLVCWWAKTNAKEYGVMGWGVLDGQAYGAGIRWHPYPPSNQWAMSPLRSDHLEAVIDKIRGRMRQATLFVAEGDLAIELLDAISEADRTM